MSSNVVGQRAKSDNKFFAAMRDKETVEAERKNLVRNVEKQAKLIDKLMDTERNLTSQLVGLPFSRSWLQFLLYIRARLIKKWRM